MQLLILGFGILFSISFFSKVFIHVYLDYKHGVNINRGSADALPFSYLLSYKGHVETRFKKLKQYCNILFRLYVGSLAPNLFLGMLSLLI